MDQRFPLHTSIPSHQRTDSFGNTPSSASPSLFSVENPLRSQSPPITPVSFPTRSYSPQFASSSVNEPNRHVPFPPTISNIEHPSQLTNPLPFQHVHRNQVPIDGEYPVPAPDQTDAILPAPPPYSRYAAGPPGQKLDGDRPQLELFDVTAAVRALPTVHIAVAPNGNVTSTSGHEPTGIQETPGSPPFVLQHSDSEVSVQSTQSTGSNRLLMTGSNKEKEKSKERRIDNKRVCGIKLWWILLATATVSIVLSIVLGVTLGLVLRQNRKNSSNYDSSLVFPEGGLLVPLRLVNQNRTCISEESELPGLTGEIEKTLWTCDLPRRLLRFEIKANDDMDDSFPPLSLPVKIGIAEDAELVITSMESGSGGEGLAIFEGVQPPSFSQQPLHRVIENNDLAESMHVEKTDLESTSTQYYFRVLYTKKVVLRLDTIERLLINQEYLSGRTLDMGLDSRPVGVGEIVWLCEWDKTYMEGLAWMESTIEDQSTSTTFRMILHERRLTNPELQQLSPVPNAGKGLIYCQKKMSNGSGDLLDPLSGSTSPNTATSADINQVKQLSEREERKMVERIVRDTARNGRKTHKRGFEQSKIIEKADGDGECRCSWMSEVDI